MQQATKSQRCVELPSISHHVFLLLKFVLAGWLADWLTSLLAIQLTECDSSKSAIATLYTAKESEFRIASNCDHYPWAAPYTGGGSSRVQRAAPSGARVESSQECAEPRAYDPAPGIVAWQKSHRGYRRPLRVRKTLVIQSLHPDHIHVIFLSILQIFKLK